MLVNSRRGQGGTDAEILDEIEKELEKAIEGNVDDADESAQAELKSDQDLASPLNKE